MPSNVTICRNFQIVCVPDVSPAAAGLARQQSLADELDTPLATPSLLMWRCEPALLVTRPETRLPHFENAAIEMQAIGWPVLLRKSGGGACPVGPGTVQVSMIEAAFPAATMKEKYTTLAELIQSTLRAFQIESHVGPVPQAYCPGSHDLAVEGKKIAGMSQHWFRNRLGIHCVVTSTSVNIEEAPEALASVMNRFYSRSGTPQLCHAMAITNMRLYAEAARLPDKHLALAFMNELSLRAGVLSGSPPQVLQCTQRAPH